MRTFSTGMIMKKILLETKRQSAQLSDPVIAN